MLKNVIPYTMIRYIILFIPLIGSLSISLRANEPQLRLQPLEHTESTRVGDSVRLVLTLTNLNLNNDSQLRSFPLETYENKPAFRTFIPLTLEKAGTFTVGPFALTVDGQTYTSNTQIIQVMDAWNGENEVHVTTDKTELMLGEKFRYTVRAWVKPDAVFKLHLDPDHPVNNSLIAAGSSSGNTYHKNRRYFARTFIFRPETSGTFILSSGIFKDWPEEIKLQPVTILVSETEEETP